jgi:FixJ family two-component response regulator
MTRLANATISIIDDDESMRLALAGLVRLLGFKAAVYASAEDFLASPCRSASSCIITDIHMPGLSGIELMERLQGGSAPVIMITGHSEPHLRAQALESGAICLLKKPFDADSLLACLKKARVA